MDNQDTISLLAKVSIRQGEENILIKYIKMFYDEIEILDKESDWSECFNIQISSDFDMIDEGNLSAILNNFAGICQYENKIPLKMSKFENTLYLKVKEA